MADTTSKTTKNIQGSHQFHNRQPHQENALHQHSPTTHTYTQRDPHGTKTPSGSVLRRKTDVVGTSGRAIDARGEAKPSSSPSLGQPKTHPPPPNLVVVVAAVVDEESLQQPVHGYSDRSSSTCLLKAWAARNVAHDRDTDTATLLIQRATRRWTSSSRRRRRTAPNTGQTLQCHSSRPSNRQRRLQLSAGARRAHDDSARGDPTNERTNGVRSVGLSSSLYRRRRGGSWGRGTRTIQLATYRGNTYNDELIINPVHSIRGFDYTTRASFPYTQYSELC